MNATKAGRPSLYKTVADQLRQQALSNPGEMMPSLRQFSEMLEVNHATISKALRELELEGLVEVVPRKGIFASARRPSQGAVELVLLFCPEYGLLDVTLQVFEGMRRAVAATHGPEGATKVTRSVLSVPPIPDAAEFVKTLRARGTAGVVFLGFGYFEGEQAAQEEAFIAEVARRIPVVLAGSPHPNLALDCVYSDPRPQLREFLEGCYADGLRSFEYLGDVGDNPHQRERRDEFDRFVTEKGLSWSWRDWRKQASSDLAAHLSHLPVLPQVIVTTNVHRGIAVTLEAQRRGLKLPGQLRILCFASLPEQAQPLLPYATVALLDEPGVGAAALKFLYQRLHPGEGECRPSVECVGARFIAQPTSQFEALAMHAANTIY